MVEHLLSGKILSFFSFHRVKRKTYISNGGVFGSLFGTPIINPPQSAILGMHGIFDRPVAVNGKVCNIHLRFFFRPIFSSSVDRNSSNDVCGAYI
jgi:hypothetical protein